MPGPGVAEELLGVGAARLVTIMAWRPAEGELERIYSSDPRLAPVDVIKGPADLGSAWIAHVLVAALPWLGRDPTALQGAFAEHESLVALGLGSCITVPVLHTGRVVGVVALLGPPRGLDDAHLRQAVEAVNDDNEIGHVLARRSGLTP